MYIDEFPGCCGILVIHHFHDSITAKTIKANLKPGHGYKRGMLVLASVNEYQIKPLKALKAFGFKAVRTFTSPNTGRKITLLSFKESK